MTRMSGTNNTGAVTSPGLTLSDMLRLDIASLDMAANTRDRTARIMDSAIPGAAQGGTAEVRNSDIRMMNNAVLSNMFTTSINNNMVPVPNVVHTAGQTMAPVGCSRPNSLEVMAGNSGPASNPRKLKERINLLNKMF